MYQGLSLSFIVSVTLRLRGVCVSPGVMLLHRHRAIIWCTFRVACSVNSGGGIVINFDVFPHCHAVIVLLMQAMTHSVANVPSHQAVKLVVVETGFIEQC